MRDNKLYTPVGVRDILFKECNIKRYVSHEIGEVFRSFGYDNPVLFICQIDTL